MIKNCIICDGEFEGRQAKALMCSDKCRAIRIRRMANERYHEQSRQIRCERNREQHRKWRAKNPAMREMKNCVICNAEFKARTSRHAACSLGCSKRSKYILGRRRDKENLDRRRKRARERYTKNPEKYRTRMQKRRAENPEKWREYSRKERTKNQEKYRERARRRRLMNQEKISEYNREYGAKRTAAFQVLKEIATPIPDFEKEKRRKYQREHKRKQRAMHPKKHRDYARKWSANNTEKRRRYDSCRNSKRTAALRLLKELETKGIGAIL